MLLKPFRPRLLLSLPLLPCIAALSCGPPPPADVVVRLPGPPASAPALVEAAPSAAASGAPGEAAAAGAIAWETSDAVARARARTRGAPLMVFLFADWAAPALRMDRATWTDAAVIRRARSFVALRLDVSAADANAQVDADRYDLRTMPSIVFLDARGNEITRIEGLAGPDEVLAAMGKVLPDN